jgi:hypothetical protein
MALGPKMQRYCHCKRPPFHYADYDTLQLGEDARGAEVSFETCRHFGAVWLNYLIEKPQYSRSGRWWRVEVSPESKDVPSAARAREFIERQSEGFVGGSFFNSQGHAIVAPIHIA